MIEKIRFKCESCDAGVTITGAGAGFSAIQRILQRAGWKVIVDLRTSRHYCPNCPEVGEWGESKDPSKVAS